jgi:4-hydroxy-tetrahydrodipicolinate synthase
VPGRTAQRLSPELLAELCNIDGVIACKEATGDVAYGQDLLLATDRVVLSGDDFTWLPLCAVGGGGVVSVLSNVAPRLCARIWSALSRGDLAEAGRLHLGSLPVSRFLFAQTNPVPVKAMLGAMGLCSPECRLPLWEGAAPPAGLTEGLA